MDESFLKELYKRLSSPKSKSFYWYLILFVFAIGGAGMWIPFLKDIGNGVNCLPDNLITFSVAIIGPSLFSLSLSFLEFKNKSSLYLFIFTILIVDIILLLIFYREMPLLPGILFVIEATLLWIVVNCDNRKLNDRAFNEDVENKVKQLSQDWD